MKTANLKTLKNITEPSCPSYSPWCDNLRTDPASMLAAAVGASHQRALRVHSLLSINDNVRVALAALHAYTAKRMIDYQIQGCRADAEILDTNLLEK